MSGDCFTAGAAGAIQATAFWDVVVVLAVGSPRLKFKTDLRAANLAC